MKKNIIKMMLCVNLLCVCFLFNGCSRLPVGIPSDQDPLDLPTPVVIKNQAVSSVSFDEKAETQTHQDVVQNPINETIEQIVPIENIESSQHNTESANAVKSNAECTNTPSVNQPTPTPQNKIDNDGLSKQQGESTNSNDSVPDTTKKVTPSLPDYTPNALAYEIFDLINDYRTSHGLQKLTFNETLCQLAYVRAEESATLWSHTRPNGNKASSVFTEYGIQRRVSTGENLAQSAVLDAEYIMQAWINSASHNENILRTEYATTGIAIYQCNNTYYIANIFNG